MTRRHAFFLLFALLVRLPLSLLGDGAVSTLFCRVPAVLAAFYYGVPCTDVTFRACGATLVVTRACAALDFFSLVAGAGLAALVAGGRRLFGAAVLLLAYPATLLANAVRLVALAPVVAFETSGAETALFGLSWLGEALHLLTGMCVFLPVFCLMWWVAWNAARDADLPHVKKVNPEGTCSLPGSLV